MSLRHVIHVSRVFVGDANDADVSINAYNIADCLAVESKEVVEIVNTQFVEHDVDVMAERKT